MPYQVFVWGPEKKNKNKIYSLRVLLITQILKKGSQKKDLSITDSNGVN